MTRIINRGGPDRVEARDNAGPRPVSGDAETRKLSPKPDDGKPQAGTQIFRPEGSSHRAQPERASGASPRPASASALNDPVVGWVVVVAGPGRGTARSLGYGMNNIGRADGQRVRLDFGDEEISRQQHAQLTYDPRGRKFYLQHGGGVNLTYIGDTPVLSPAELKGGEVIGLGSQTQLRFVPFCGPDFDWQDQ